MTNAEDLPQAVLEIPGDVDASTGNVQAASDVVVAGTVRESRRIESAGNITIRGNVEVAAVVEARSDVHIDGGITTQHKGRVTAGGAIHTRFCDEGDLRAGGDVIIDAGVINSRLHAGGMLRVEQGALVGGEAYAREGAVVKALGNDNQIKTQFAVGVHPEVLADSRQLATEVKKQKEASARIREMVAPLLAQLKRLNPQQREKATELMYQADSIDASIQERLDLQAKVLAASMPSGPAEIVVTERVFPNVMLVFGDKVTAIRQERQGPLKICRRQVGRVEEVILEELATGVTTTLISQEYTPVRPAATAKGGGTP